MNDDSFEIRINESYDQIRKYFNDAENPIEFFSHISSIREETEKKINEISEEFSHTLNELTDFIQQKTRLVVDNKKESIDFEQLNGLREIDFWVLLQSKSETFLNILHVFRRGEFLSNDIENEFNEFIDKLERLLKIGVKLHSTFLSSRIAIDLILQDNFKKNSLPDFSDIDNNTIDRLSGGALRKRKDSINQFKMHIDNLALVIKETLKGKNLNEHYTSKGYISNNFLAIIHRKHKKKHPLSIHTLRNWFQNSTKKKMIAEKIEKLISEEPPNT